MAASRLSEWRKIFGTILPYLLQFAVAWWCEIGVPEPWIVFRTYSVGIAVFISKLNRICL